MEDSQRIYTHAKLIGPVEVAFSGRLRFPKFHIDHDCEGLERTPAEARLEKSYANASELGLDFSGRPCRQCSLESVLLTTLAPRPRVKKVFVTATSQSNPLDPGAKIYNYRWRESTESGRARIIRLAKALNFEIASTPAGPALYGFVPFSAAAILSHNLRTVIRREITEMPSAQVVEVAWTLYGDNPPELGMPAILADVWETAEALA